MTKTKKFSIKKMPISKVKDAVQIAARSPSGEYITKLEAELAEAQKDHEAAMQAGVYQTALFRIAESKLEIATEALEIIAERYGTIALLDTAFIARKALGKIKDHEPSDWCHRHHVPRPCIPVCEATLPLRGPNKSVVDMPDEYCEHSGVKLDKRKPK
jgi:hypothetical protein